jgi:hypothetical protein
MDSKEHRMTLHWAPLAFALAACAPSERRFPLAAPMWRDTDLGPVAVACHREPTPKDPHHVSCAPEVRDAPLIWDGVDNMLFRPLSETIGVATGGESVNVNSLDEVPDSSWFTNRLGVRPMTVDEFALGDCEPSQIIDPEQFADGSWTIDHGKMGGSTDGFRVTIPGKGKFLFKADDSAQSEHSSAAQTIGATVYRAAGYYTTCEQVIYFKRSLLKLTPGLKWKHNFGETQEFDRKALDRVLAHCPKRGELVRIQASEWIPGYPIGGFGYFGTRPDDPNDVVPHEDRRELRAMRVLNAWLDRFDARSGNTLDMWFPDAKGSAPDASPGHVIHNQMDTSECLGSAWDWDPISRRLGYSYIADWGAIASDFFSLGIPLRTWDTIDRTPGKEMFAYFNVKDFVPDQWKDEYPTAAFSRMTERDGAWMARTMARITPEMVHALARLARFTDIADTAFLESTLNGRMQKVLERYLTRLSPIAGVHVEGSSTLCGVDLAEWRGLRDPERFDYAARMPSGPWLRVERRAGAELCVTLPHVTADSGLRDDARERYVRVRIQDGVARGPLLAHLYDLGPTRGYRLVGIERPEP